MFRRTTLLLCMLIYTVILSVRISISSESVRDRQALGTIFADQQVDDSAWSVHRRALQMPETERFEFLANWVLPGPDHATFRLALDFSPTNPAPPVRDPDDALQAAAAMRDGRSRVPTGGNLVSPALDLIQSATRLGRLKELRSRVDASAANDELQERCRLAMLGLVDLALKDFDRAHVSFDELFARVTSKTYDSFPGRWPETLAIHECIQHARTRGGASELLYQMLQSQVRSGVARGPDAWDHWVTVAAGRLTSISAGADAGPNPAASVSIPAAGIDAFRNWSPVSRTTAWSRGQGLPCAVWRLSPGGAENLASHDDDFLYYRLPLRGDFEVECDVSGFNWRDTHLMVAGTYVAPIYDHVTYGLGTFRGEGPAGTIDPRLSECDEWIRYRAVVRNNECSTYFNGRLIHVEPLSPEHDPWLAVRSTWFADGSVRNLTIRGTPTIPDRVRLSLSSELTGWNAYHGEPVGGDDYWRHVGDLEHGGAILGRREPWLAKAAVERLLQYNRPMLEDGTIAYEFFYRDGDSHVHPALDRRAFILDRDGVHTHWVTDGTFERTSLSPLERDALADAGQDPQVSSTALPLRESTWNQMRLTLTGDHVELFLNDQLVYRGQLEPTNLRTFGLFHWADQTEARVRNVVWTGAWPRELPAVEKQEMAGDGLRFLDRRLPELTAQFEHDFTRDGLPPELFGVHDDATVESGDGVRLVVRRKAGYTFGWIAPKLRLHGDFDVRAQFERFTTSGPIDSSCGIQLTTITDDPEHVHSSVYRGTFRRPDAPDRQVVQAEFNHNRPDGPVMTWPACTSEEATSGTLRLARRGDQLYCLIAEGDSEMCRLIHTETVATEPTIFDGVRLMAATYSIVPGDATTAVTWKRLSIRAEEITDLP